MLEVYSNNRLLAVVRWVPFLCLWLRSVIYCVSLLWFGTAATIPCCVWMKMVHWWALIQPISHPSHWRILDGCVLDFSFRRLLSAPLAGHSSKTKHQRGIRRKACHGVAGSPSDSLFSGIALLSPAYWLAAGWHASDLFLCFLHFTNMVAAVYICRRLPDYLVFQTRLASCTTIFTALKCAVWECRSAGKRAVICSVIIASCLTSPLLAALAPRKPDVCSHYPRFNGGGQRRSLGLADAFPADPT